MYDEIDIKERKKKTISLRRKKMNETKNANVVTHPLESILPNFFLRKRIIFPFFGTTLGHCSVHKSFSYATNSQA